MIHRLKVYKCIRCGDKLLGKPKMCNSCKLEIRDKIIQQNTNNKVGHNGKQFFNRYAHELSNQNLIIINRKTDLDVRQ